MLQMKNINVIINEQKKQFNQIEKRKLQNVDFITKFNKILIERFEQTMSHSKNNIQIIAQSSRNVEMSDMFFDLSNISRFNLKHIQSAFNQSQRSIID